MKRSLGMAGLMLTYFPLLWAWAAALRFSRAVVAYLFFLAGFCFAWWAALGFSHAVVAYLCFLAGFCFAWRAVRGFSHADVAYQGEERRRPRPWHDV